MPSHVKARKALSSPVARNNENMSNNYFENACSWSTLSSAAIKTSCPTNLQLPQPASAEERGSWKRCKVFATI